MADANQVQETAANIQILTAVIGLLGVLIGSAISVLGNIALHHYQNKRENSLSSLRKRLLKTMLDDQKFEEGRSLSTLSRVCGAEPEECRRLLLELSARGFTLHNGEEGWTYIKNREWPEQ